MLPVCNLNQGTGQKTFLQSPLPATTVFDSSKSSCQVKKHLAGSS